MVNFKKLTDKAKDVVDKRGGTGSLKADAGEVKDIFKGKGSITDKAKAAASAIKDPGAAGEERDAEEQAPANSQKAQKPIAKTEEQPRPAGEPDREAREKKRMAETKTEEQRAK